jgi:hypothetical protein
VVLLLLAQAVLHQVTAVVVLLLILHGYQLVV